MSEKKLETVISVSDKFSSGIIEFEKRLTHTQGPIGRLESHLKNIDKLSGFEGFRKGFAGFRDNVGKALQSVTNLGTGIGIVAGATGVFVAKVNKIALMGDSLLKTSKRLGMTVESLQKFEFVAERSGVPVDVMQKNMQKLAVTAMRAAGGMKKESLAFNYLGIKAKKINGDVKSTEELLVELSDKFAYKSLTATEKLYAAQEIFGKQGASMVNLLEQGPEKIRAEMTLVKQLGLMDQAQAEASQDYADAVTAMNWAFRGLAVTIGAKAIPMLTEATKKITEMFSMNKDRYVESLTKIIEKIPPVVDTILDRLPGLMDFGSKLIGGINWLVDRLGVVIPMGTIIIGSVLVPLTAAIYHLVKIMYSFVRVAKTARSGLTFLKEGMFGSSKAVEKLSVSTQKTSAVIEKSTNKSSKQLRKLKKEAQKAEIRMQKLALTNKKTAASFDVMGTSASKSGMMVNSAGKSAVKTAGKLLGVLSALDVAGNVFANVTDKDNERLAGMSGIDRVLRATMDEFESLPIIGGILKGLENLSVDKVKFDDPKNDILGGSSFEDSDLFGMAATKTINNNTHSTIDVNFNGFPKNTEIKKRGYNDPSFGYSMSPSF